MALRDNPFSELRLPLLLGAVAALIIALVSALALLLSDRRETLQIQAYGVTQKVGDQVVAPVSGWISTPPRLVQDGLSAIRQYFFAVSENRRLRAELEQARQWRSTAIALQDSSERYRALLGLKVNPPVAMVSGLAVTDSRGPFANSRLVNVGSEMKIEVGNPVMNENGLVGRVVGVAPGVSRVLLLTDVSSRTPVLIDRTNSRAIMVGDGGPNPRLDYLRGQDPVQENDPVLSSGDGGVMPRGIPVGRAVKGLDGRWRVVLSADAGSIDYVRILLFKDFRQLANLPRLAELSVPPPSMEVAVPEGAGLKPAAEPAVVPVSSAKPVVVPAVVRPVTPGPAASRPAKPQPGTNRPAVQTSVPVERPVAQPSSRPAAEDGDIPH